MLVYKKAAVAVAMSLIAAALAVADPPKPRQLPASHMAQGLTYAPALAVRQWTASDRPYKDVEAQMAQEFASGKTPQAILEQYQRLAANHPKDPVMQFAAVCAARGAVLASNAENLVPYALVQTLADFDPGNVHEYVRYRFCMTEEAGRNLPTQNTEAIGRRLLQYNPKDHFVRLNMIYMLCDSGHAQAALPYAQEWVKTEPNNEKAHSSLALVCQDLWFATKNKSYGRQSVEEFQRYLRVAPSGDGFRQNAEHSIKVIQEEVAKAT